jgi:hypothetical protein
MSDIKDCVDFEVEIGEKKKEKIKKLSEFSEDELFEEIQRREKEKRPKPSIAADLTKLRNVCDEYLTWLERERRGNNNVEHFIFEEALKALYGQDIFSWINAHLD